MKVFNLQKMIIIFICQVLDVLPLRLALECAASGLSVPVDSKLDIGELMGLWGAIALYLLHQLFKKKLHDIYGQ